MNANAKELLAAASALAMHGKSYMSVTAGTKGRISTGASPSASGSL